jgi:hypothetical protein
LAMSCQRHAQLLWKYLLSSLQLWKTSYFGIIQSWREPDCCIRDQVYPDLDISKRFSKCIRRLDGMHEERCMNKGKFVCQMVDSDLSDIMSVAFQKFQQNVFVMWPSLKN